MMISHRNLSKKRSKTKKKMNEEEDEKGKHTRKSGIDGGSGINGFGGKKVEKEF